MQAQRRSARLVSAASMLLAGFCLLRCTTTSAGPGPAVPPGAPPEDVRFATEWPAPNGDLYNTRVAHTTIASANVAQLGVTWTIALPSAAGGMYANPVIANGIAYLQDAASNVMAVRDATGARLWTHPFNSVNSGPNGVTIANGRVYGVTATGVFALDAQTGQQVWYDTDLAPKAHFDIVPQVDDGKVFVSSAETVGGGVIYALDAATGAVTWRFQTVIDKTGQQLSSTAGGAWDTVLIGPDHAIYAGIGNPYLSLQDAQTQPSQELYTDSLVKLDEATGKLEWYYQAFPDDFHDWDLESSPIYTSVGGHPVVLAAGKGGYVFAFDPASGKLLWKTAVGSHNGHDDDDQLALQGKLNLTTPYTLEPGETGGVETNMAAAGGVVYVPVDNLPGTYPTAAARVPTTNFAAGAGELDAIDIASGKLLWTTKLPQLALGGATVSNDLVFTSTFTGQIFALSRKSGAIAWSAKLPAGTNATPAITGNMLLVGAGVPLSRSQPGMIVAYTLGAHGSASPTPGTAVTSVPGR